MLLFIIVLLLSGLVIGGLARLAVPGPDPMPIWMTILLGWAGSLIGGLLARLFLGRPGGFLVGLACSILLLVLHRRYVQHRPITGPRARSRF